MACQMFPGNAGHCTSWRTWSGRMAEAARSRCSGSMTIVAARRIIGVGSLNCDVKRSWRSMKPVQKQSTCRPMMKQHMAGACRVYGCRTLL